MSVGRFTLHLPLAALEAPGFSRGKEGASPLTPFKKYGSM